MKQVVKQAHCKGCPFQEPSLSIVLGVPDVSIECNGSEHVATTDMVRSQGTRMHLGLSGGVWTGSRLLVVNECILHRRTSNDGNSHGCYGRSWCCCTEAVKCARDLDLGWTHTHIPLMPETNDSGGNCECPATLHTCPTCVKSRSVEPFNGRRTQTSKLVHWHS